MILNKKLALFVVFGTALCLTLGCGSGKTGSRDGLVKTSGIVNYKGAPVEGAIVEFHPAGDAPANSSAVGRTDAKGEFTLMTDRPNDGALPGKYKVVVKKQEDAAPKPATPVDEKDKKNEKRGDDKKKGIMKELLPVKYGNKEKTPIEMEIPAGGAKNLKIDLED